ncbi:DUF4190 domain-containing protein [Actinocrinis puniceicyclus]|uniref:DUF4190 domain-containing protein n=1 Tax=Actinocrinis puniceicyclus TaxID=977794 RepID=A0A8J7WIV5_9ACTN|nr:DUF4190 domain-containing protein [Actinocrinis puniceicyclus]MBS2961730.1 DUF4190 domain-containing protein [Actinocrinis puniceicyclus]
MPSGPMPTAQAPLDQPVESQPTAQYPAGGYPGDGFAHWPGDQGAPGYPPNQGLMPYGYPYPYPMMPMAPPPRGLAITGMVLGIVGLCTSLFYVGGVVGIVGLVFSIIAIRKAGRGQAAGKGMAIAGLVTSILAIIANVLEIVVIVWFVSTAANCHQYSATPDPVTGTSQYELCLQRGFFGN